LRELAERISENLSLGKEYSAVVSRAVLDPSARHTWSQITMRRWLRLAEIRKSGTIIPQPRKLGQIFDVREYEQNRPVSVMVGPVTIEVTEEETKIHITPSKKTTVIGDVSALSSVVDEPKIIPIKRSVIN
jgi:hypothetical protein